MYEVELLNLDTGKRFKKVFWNLKEKDNFVRKCKYSKKVMVVSTTDNSKFYD